jgi:hypothetical protein
MTNIESNNLMRLSTTLARIFSHIFVAHCGSGKQASRRQNIRAIIFAGVVFQLKHRLRILLTELVSVSV